jgi:putative transposase
MAYSVDLRRRVVNAVREGEGTQEEVAKRFKVSLSSLKRWLNREDLAADKPGPRGPRLDIEALKKAVQEKPDAYLDEYAQMLNTSDSTVSYNLIKLGIRRKKNHTIFGAERRRAQSVSTAH